AGGRGRGAVGRVGGGHAASPVAAVRGGGLLGGVLGQLFGAGTVGGDSEFVATAGGAQGEVGQPAGGGGGLAPAGQGRLDQPGLDRLWAERHARQRARQSAGKPQPYPFH